jgi:hypothetical protein
METRTETPKPLTAFVPRTPLAKKLLEVRQEIIASGRALLDWEDIDRERLQQRRRWGKSEEER